MSYFCVLLTDTFLSPFWYCRENKEDLIIDLMEISRDVMMHCELVKNQLTSVYVGSTLDLVARCVIHCAI